MGSSVGERVGRSIDREVLPERLRTEAAQRLNAAGMELPDVLPGNSDALRGIHLPESEADLTAAQTRLVFQELLVMQLALAIETPVADQ